MATAVLDDPQVVELVAEEARIKQERNEAALQLLELKETDAWGDGKADKYQRLTADHLRLESSLRTVSEAKDRRIQFASPPPGESRQRSDAGVVALHAERSRRPQLG